MSNGAKLVVYLAAFIVFVVAAIIAQFGSKWWPTFVAAGLALLTLVPLIDAVKAD